MKKKLVFSLIVLAVFLLVLEGLSRLLENTLSPRADRLPAEPGWQTKFFATLFDWHEPDPDLLWRFKANLNNPLIHTNSVHLIGEEVSKKKPSNTFRVLVLGDSSPVGLGLSSYRLTFGALLERLLAVECQGGKELEVINAAVSGYTSEQIDRLLDVVGWSYDPDLIILYCGNNDASVSGPCTDRELLQRQTLKTPRKLLSRFAAYRVLRDILLRIHSRVARTDVPLLLRVSPRRFGENLRSIASACRRHDCPLIVLKPPVPYLWPAGLQFKIFTHVHGEQGRYLLPEAMTQVLGREIKYCLNDELFAHLYGRGDRITRSVYRSAYTDSLSPARAVAYYSERLRSHPDDPVLLNNLGVSCWEEGEYVKADSCLRQARKSYVGKLENHPDPALVAAGSPFLYNIGINLMFVHRDSGSLLPDANSVAFAYLDSALQADYFSLRIKRSYWMEIDKLQDLPYVTVIDLPRIFRENGGERLFIDHCHPTAEGHLLIARELFSVICHRFGARL